MRLNSARIATTPERRQYEGSHEEVVRLLDRCAGEVFRGGARLNVPVYLDDEVGEYLEAWAEAKVLEVGRLVNDFLRREIEIIESVKKARPVASVRPRGGR